MAAIPDSNLRHVRKTINFDGGANNGNLGDEVTVFTPTGRVMLIGNPIIYCSDALVCAAGAATQLNFGADDPGLFGIAGTVDAFNAVGGFFDGSAILSDIPLDPTGDRHGYAISQPVVVEVADLGGGADVTDGTLIIDAFYRPITDDGALAGDDIDSGYAPSDLKAVAGSTTSVSALATGVATLLADWINGGRLDLLIDAIKAKTDLIPADPADASDIAALIDALPTASEIFTAVLTTALTEAYAANGAAPTLAQAIFAIHQRLMAFAMSGTAISVKKLDGSTEAFEITLDSATIPTSSARA